MFTPHLAAAFVVVTALVARQDEPSSEPPADPAPAEQPSDAPSEAPAEQPADAPADAPAEQPSSSPAAAPAAPAAPPKPFSLRPTSDERPCKSPYAVDVQVTGRPKVYVVPMVGEMGTDIHGKIDGKPGIYDRIVDDIVAKKPDLLLFVLDSTESAMFDKDDIEKAMNDRGGDRKVDPRQRASALEEYRDLANQLRKERLASYPAVMYVKDARGMSALIAMSFPYVFMAPKSRISGLDIVGALAGGNDADILAKMRSAWEGITQGTLELGGRQMPLAEALVQPDKVLSCSIDGRSTKWRSDTDGDWYIVDSSPKAPARFTAKVAEETGLVDGIAEDEGDLLNALGYPEYDLVESGRKMFEDYGATWKKRFAESKKLVEDYQEAGTDLPGLSKRKQAVEKLRALCKQYPPLARSWAWTYGIDDDWMRVQLEQIGEQIRAAQKERRGNSGGGTPGRGRGSGGGGSGLGN
jgi:hypothetical protein